jgi:hypothetical protein
MAGFRHTPFTCPAPGEAWGLDPLVCGQGFT